MDLFHALAICPRSWPTFEKSYINSKHTVCMLISQYLYSLLLPARDFNGRERMWCSECVFERRDAAHMDGSPLCPLVGMRYCRP